MKDEFISTVSHELRTPLTSLWRAALGLVSSGALDKRPEKQRQMVEMAIGNCDRLVRLVNDILDFDSVEKGRLSLQRQSVRRSTAAAGCGRGHSTAGTARIDFLINAAPAMVLADEERIMQVLNELVTNAIKFSKQDTTIRLSARRAVAKGFGRERGVFHRGGPGPGIAQESWSAYRALPAGRCIGLADAGRDGPGFGAVPQHCGAARRARSGRRASGQGQPLHVHASGAPLAEAA